MSTAGGRMALLLGASALSAAAAVRSHADASIVATHRVDEGAGRYTAFPSIYFPRDAGTILFNVTARPRRSHHDAAGESIFLASADCGETWRATDQRAPASVFAEAGQGHYSMIAARAWRALEQGEPLPDGARSWREGAKTFVAIGTVEKTTQDGGRTWKSVEIPVPKHAMLMNYNIASHLRTSRGARITALYYAEQPASRHRVLMAVKPPAATRWRFVPIPAGDDPASGFDETALVEIPDGRVVALMRPDPDRSGYLFASLSADQGLTWSKPAKTGIYGYPASAVMHGGKLVVTVGNRHAKPMSIDAYLLQPDTLSIERRFALDTATGNPADFGYPVSLACKDRIVTTYYVPGPSGSAYSKVLAWKP